ncbi:YopX family protein [Streptococcus suis]|uniref:YopX family protein n=1 Tax=Streptococcus suis TaxID=1307 RepID=UPI00300FAEF6
MIPKYRVAYKNKILGEVGSIDFIDQTVTVPVYDSETGEYLADLELGLNQVILMQSTGLFDVNDKEIFEGDVVKVFDDKLSKIYYSDGAFCVDILNGGTPLHAFLSEQLEIIGNIYENPELMEG